MTEVINKYETMIVFDNSMPEEEVTALFEKFKSLIEQNSTLEEVAVWGKRRLAYEIDDKTEGHYVLITFSAKPEFIAELERVYRITEGVLRYINIRLNK